MVSTGTAHVGTFIAGDLLWERQPPVSQLD
jgi:hypothetical protein